MFFFFFFNDTATTEIYTLSLHDALPISKVTTRSLWSRACAGRSSRPKTSSATANRSSMQLLPRTSADRKSTRLNSSHANISYAVFCLKKKKQEVRLLLVYDVMQQWRSTT